MKREFTKLMAALALLTFLAVPMGMWGQTRETTTGTLNMSTSQTSPVTVNGVTFTWTSANIVTGGSNTSGFKANSNMTVTIPSGAILTKIEKTNGNTWGNSATISVYAGSDDTGTNIASIVTGTHVYNISSNNTGTTYYFANKTAKNAWIKSLSITYEVSSGASTTVTIDATGITNTDVYTSTVAGSLSATVSANGEAITGATVAWSSSNENVATIDEDGVVTLVAAGTTTITAAYGGESGVYNPSSATYELAVTSSAPYVQPTTVEAGLNDAFFGTNYGGSAAGISDENPVSGTQDNVTITYAGGGNHYINATQIRFYPSNKLTFEAPSGYEITQIVFTSDGTWAATISVDNGTYTSDTKTWTGSSASVIFTGSGSSRCDMSKATITLAAQGCAVATTTTINVPANFNNDIQGTTAGTLTATVSAEGNPISGATVTWTSSDTNVATIDANGAVTLVAVGTTTITASYAGVEDEYRPSEGSYELTVVNEDPNAPGTQNKPYTVAEAIANTPNSGTSSDVYIHGYVSSFYGSNDDILDDNSHRYYISDDGSTTTQLLVYKGKGLNNVDFSNVNDLLIGDEVTILGGLTMYQSAPEIAANNYIVSLVRPQSTDPVINAENVTLAYDATSGSIAYTITNPVTGVTLQATTDATWISNIVVGTEAVSFTTTANEGNADRTATITLSYTGATDKAITVTQGHYQVDYAELPFTWTGGTSSDLTALTGVTGNSLSDYASTNVPYRIKLDNTGDYIQVKTDSRPGIVTIGVKMIGGGDTSYITVKGSTDGQSFDDGEALEISGSQNDKLTLTSTRSFGADVRYIRLYFTKGSNVGVGPITISKYTAYDLTVTLGEHVEAIYVFNAADYSDALIEDGAAGTVEVPEGTSIEVSPAAASGYMISSLLINNEDVFSQMSGGAYTFTMTGDITITATAVEYVEPYTILFSVNGEEYEAGEMAILPEHTLGELPVPENIPEGFTFVGWMESPTDAYYNATTAPTMVSSSTVPEDDMILDAVFCISETAQGTYVLSNAAPTDGDWVVLAVNVDGTYYAMNGPDADELTVTNNTIVGTLNAAFEAKKITQNDTDYIGLTKDGGTQYVHLNSSAIKIANGTSNGFLEFTQSGTGYLVYTEATVSNVTVTRYIQYSNSEFTVTTDDEEASTLYVFKYVPGATTNKDYTTLVINHTEDLIAEDDNETFYGIHYINDYVFAGNDVTNKGKLVVNNEGTLDMDANTLYNSVAANLVIEDGGQLIHSTMDLPATMKKTIVGYGNVNNKGGWYLLSSPLGTIDAGDATVTNLMSGPADNYDIYGFDQGATDLREWRNYKLIPDGYSKQIKYMGGVLYGNIEDMTATFTGTLSNGGNAITLDYTDGFRLSGFNIVGNPLSSDAYLYGKTKYYRLQENAQGESELVETSHTVAIAPMEAVFVQAEGEEEEEVYFSTLQPTSKHKMINLQVMHNRGQLVDRACVAFGEGSVLGKFQLNENNTKIYFTQGNKDYAVVRSDAQGELPVGFHAGKNGTYTVNVETENVEMSYLHLFDDMTGADIDLLQTPSYTFEANVGDNANRFRLMFDANAIDEHNAEANFAFFNGSEWVISNMGEATLQVVDVMGRVISSETINGNAELSISEVPGVYMFRLVNGNNVKVQKVVVR